jgi:hypothetical protein
MRSVELGGERFSFELHRSDRTRARLIVAPDGRIELRVPKETSEGWIDDFMRRRARWIIRQRLYFEQFRPREPQRRYVSGETVRYLGRQYLLRVTRSDRVHVRLHGKHLEVEVASPRNREQVQCAVQSWYSGRAVEVFARRAERCLPLVRPYGCGDPPILVRRMTRRWGSCTPKGRILLNPYLVVAPSDCADYVLVHELCHIRHPHHNEAFYRMLTTVMPDWLRRRQRLEKHGPYLTL